MPTVAPREFDLLAELHRLNKRTIVLREDSELLGRYSKNPRLLLSRMARKGLVRSISRGRYLVVGPGGGSAAAEASPFVLIDGAIQPRRYAVSFLSALTYYGLTDHEPYEITLLLDERPSASAPRELGGMPVRVKIERREHRWFGIRTEDARGGSFRIADPERTIVDCLDRPELAGGPELVVRGLARALRDREVRPRRLRGYAERHSIRVARRLGFLLELLDAATREELAELESVAKRSNRTDVLFGIDGDSPDLPRNARWRLRLDAPSEVVAGWAAYEAAV